MTGVGRTHSGTPGQTDRRRYRRTDGLASGQKEGRTDRWAEERMHGLTDRRRERRTDGQASGQKDGRTEGWAEKSMHGRRGGMIGWTDGLEG